MDTFFYTEDDFLFQTNSHPSTFFELLKSAWDAKMNEGNIFWYKLNITLQRFISNKFILQFNPERASLKRSSAVVHSSTEPFNPENFNFNQIRREEKLLLFSLQGETPKHVVVVNVSPLEYCHVLLVPDPTKCFPQVLTETSLLIALHFILVTGNRYFRVGFNGLGAYASVNHLHFHGYLLEHDMFLESAVVEELVHPCYQLLNYPAKGFVFQIRNRDEINSAVKNIFNVVKLIQTGNIFTYNLFITRGLDFDSTRNVAADKSARNCLRIYVWARTPTWGAKELTAFNIATCELFGHMVIKDETDYHTLTEENINAALYEVTNEPFESMLPDVKKLF